MTEETNITAEERSRFPDHPNGGTEYSGMAATFYCSEYGQIVVLAPTARVLRRYIGKFFPETVFNESQCQPARLTKI